MEEKIPVENGDIIHIRKLNTGWEYWLGPKGGGIVQKVGLVLPTFDEIVLKIKSNYEID